MSKATSSPGNVVPTDYMHKEDGLHHRVSSLETTAGRAQTQAPNPTAAEEVNRYATREQEAAEEAARRAQKLGSNYTGKPEGDADSAEVRSAMASTSVKIGQSYSSGNKDSSSSPSSNSDAHGVDEAKGYVSSLEDSASAVLQSAKETVSPVVNKVIETTEGYLGMGKKPGENPTVVPDEAKSTSRN
ncbi:hypothetical protein FA15DRAFT_662954 [Coprinopsis marcescibilis]|uniref:Uncharacterized protein n=1 Tax=Coprinopsis marcescibilis TaxID=230819 RepID=A0A5C3LDJ5_COPMA|nr:hypothetical protein FA15DRAFT_662954 [Coprinopsis marcescibilis]